LGVKGVAEVSSFGGKLKQFEIAIDPNKLQSHNITIHDVFTALETNTAKKNASNDFNGNTVANETYNKFYGATYALGIISTPQFINLNNGPLQYVTFAADTTITFQSWPTTGKYAVVRVHLIGDGNAIRTPTLATEGGGTFAYETGYPNPLTLPLNGKNKVIEAWTYNGGAKVFVKYVGEF
jgi:hypothetical protein